MYSLVSHAIHKYISNIVTCITCHFYRMSLVPCHFYHMSLYHMSLLSQVTCVTCHLCHMSFVSHLILSLVSHTFVDQITQDIYIYAIHMICTKHTFTCFPVVQIKWLWFCSFISHRGMPFSDMIVSS